MAFTAAEVEAEDPNAWSGKTTALVYETPETVSARLVRRGLAAFSGSPAADQEAALLVAVEDAEDAIRGRFRGASVTEGQRLLFPAFGAYDGRGRLLRQDEAPIEYLEGIGLIAEEIRAGTYMVLAPDGGGVGVKVEATRNTRTEYREGLDLTALSTNHPKIWRKLAMALPRTL